MPRPTIITVMRGVRAMALTVGVASLALLTACSPLDEPVVGLEMRDGKPVIVIVACPDWDAWASVYLVDELPTPAPTGAAPSRSGSAGPPSAAPTDDDEDGYRAWEVSAVSPEPVTEIPLFQRPPRGWEVDDDELTRLEPGREYAISGHSGRDSIDVHFTVEDLKRLGPGQVLVETGEGRRGTTPRSSFVAWAADSC